MMIQIRTDHRVQMSAVRDQGQRETCLSHATSAAHEKSRDLVQPLSPEYLHYFASGGKSGGCTIEEMAGALERHGQPIEPHCPYLPADPSPAWRPAVGLEVFKRTSAQGQLDIAGVEKIIESGAVPVLAISLPREFFQPSAPWIIPVGRDIMGLHAVAGVGVGTRGADKTILIRNSWGDAWGDGGHAWLSEDFISQRLCDVLVLKQEVTQ